MKSLWDKVSTNYKNSFLADQRGEVGDVDKKLAKKLQALEDTIEEQNKIIKQLQKKSEEDSEIISASKEFFDVLDKELGNEDEGDEEDENYEDEDEEEDEDYSKYLKDEDEENEDEDEEYYDDEDIEGILARLEAEEEEAEKKERDKRIKLLEKRVQEAEKLRNDAEMKNRLSERDKSLVQACEAAGAVDIHGAIKLFKDNLEYDETKGQWHYVTIKNGEKILKSIEDGVKEEMPLWAKKSTTKGGSGASETTEDKSTVKDSQKKKVDELAKEVKENPSRPEILAKFMTEKAALKTMEGDTTNT